MNWKKYFIALVVMYVVFELLNFLFHGLLMASYYQSMEGVWRPDMDSKMWIVNLMDLIFLFFFIFIFTKGYQGKGVMEGIRYGLIIGCLFVIPMNYIEYAIFNLTYWVVLVWVIFGFIQMIIAGALVSLLYKPAESASCSLI